MSMKQISIAIVAFAMFGVIFSILPSAYSQTYAENEEYRLYSGAGDTLYTYEKSVRFSVPLLGDYDEELIVRTAHVWSDSDSEGYTAYLAKNKGQNYLSGLIHFSTDLNSVDEKLKVKAGDELFVKYRDSIISFVVEEYISPLKQQQSGVASELVECKHDRANMQRLDGSAACMKFESTSFLVEKGWILMPGQIFKG